MKLKWFLSATAVVSMLCLHAQPVANACQLNQSGIITSQLSTVKVSDFSVELEGYVRNSAGVPVAGAVITILGVNYYTDSSGFYNITLPSGGAYLVTYTIPGCSVEVLLNFTDGNTYKYNPKMPC